MKAIFANTAEWIARSADGQGHGESEAGRREVGSGCGARTDCSACSCQTYEGGLAAQPGMLAVEREGASDPGSRECESDGGEREGSVIGY
jgi:hypothetical protein